MAFTLTSAAFDDGDDIPPQYTCDGRGNSPELSWRGAPEATRGYALILHDPDSTKRPDFTHWVLFDLAGDAERLPEDAGDSAGRPGVNDFGKPGYGGPCPAVGRHRYMFDLYALDKETLGLPEGASREDVEGAMEGHMLARARLTGSYERQKPQGRPEGSPLP